MVNVEEIERSITFQRIVESLLVGQTIKAAQLTAQDEEDGTTMGLALEFEGGGSAAVKTGVYSGGALFLTITAADGEEKIGPCDSGGLQTPLGRVAIPDGVLRG